MLTDYAIQPVTTADESFLWQVLYYAAHMDEQPGISPESAKTDPALAPYVAGLGNGPADLGFVARLTTDNSATGAAWLRLMPSGWPLHRYINAVPEIAIAVLPEYLGRGIGSRLLATLAEAAAGRFPARAQRP
jgi:GNAT superfamily N-acetyltransferase